MNVLLRVGDRSARFAQAYVPDPFVISVLLAGVAVIVALAVGASFLDVTVSFATGALEPSLLAFGFEMALILLTGHALAEAPAVRAVLRAVADRPTTTASAAAVVAAVAMALGLLNWGLGLVAGAFLAREVGRSFARRKRPLNYPLIGAAGYMGLLVWHGGLSGSAPLTVARAGAFGEAVPVTQTLFSPLNLVTTAALFVVITLLFRALGAGDPPAAQPTAPDTAGSEEGTPEGRGGVAGALERTVFVTAIVVVPLAVALGRALWTNGAAAINLEWVILLFLAAGLVLHRRPASYVRAFTSGAGGAGAILLQFPLYFGVMAIMRDSGAMAQLAEAFAAVSAQLSPTIPAKTTASVGTFLSASIINLFVPSGGGQWKLQSPLILQTAQALSLDRAPLVMAFSYGDQLTNMLQPFWALPLLSITGLGAKDVMGYTVLAMLAAVPVILLCLVLL